MLKTRCCAGEFMSTRRWNAIVLVGHSENQARISAKQANPQDLSIERSLSKISGNPFQSRCIEA